MNASDADSPAPPASVDRQGQRVRPLVVVPTYNNADSIAEVVVGCLERCPDVLVVDDGCTDDTAVRAGQARGPDGRRARLVSHPVNRGKGAAIATALGYARSHGFTHIVTIDADGQHLPEELPRFFDAARRDPWAIIVGVRDMADAPESSRFGRRFSNFWIWVETGHRVGDSQSGFRVYPVMPVSALKLPRGRYEWEVAVLVWALWGSIAVRDLPCAVHYPPPEERVSSFRPFWDNARISLLNTRLVAGRILWPPRWINRVPEPGGTWQGQHRGRAWGWAVFLGVVRVLGRRVGHLCMLPLAVFYLLMGKAPRKGAFAYLRRRFPDQGVVRAWLRAGRIFYNFACSLVDRFHLLLRGPDAFDIQRDEAVQAFNRLPADQGALLVTAHMGNPDLAGTCMRSGASTSDRRDIALVQYTSEADPYLATLRRVDSHGRVPRIIALQSGQALASLEVVRALRGGTLVALKADRSAGDRTVAVPLLGGTIDVSVGPFILAALAQVPIVVLSCFREGPGYRLVAAPHRQLRFTSRATRQADLERWAREYAAVLESWTEDYPLQWYNFHDPWADAAAAGPPEGGPEE